MIPALLNENVTVSRRASTGRDALGNPIYGTPTSGAGWTTVYASMPCRIALTDNQIKFDHVGERVLPFGTVYYGTAYALQVEDRIITQNSQVTANSAEYVVKSIRVAYSTSQVIDHYEAVIDLP